MIPVNNNGRLLLLVETPLNSQVRTLRAATAVFKMLQFACNIINPSLFPVAHVPSSQGEQGIFGAQPTLQIYTVAILLALPVHVARLAFEWLILISISACEKFGSMFASIRVPLKRVFRSLLSRSRRGTGRGV